MPKSRVLLRQTSSLRRYIAIVQDPRGYPAAGAPLEKAPPDGPEQPVLHQVVKADEHEAELEQLRERVEHLEMEISEKTAWLERDKREPDKVLCHIASLRRALNV